MKIGFTNAEKESIRSIMDQYQEISKIIEDYQKEANDIQERIKTAKDSLDKVKNKEDELMSELRKKYGDFGLQDIYDTMF